MRFFPLPPNKHSYDSKCFDLAEAFLGDEPHIPKEATGDLAQEIQQCIEDFIDDWKATTP